VGEVMGEREEDMDVLALALAVPEEEDPSLRTMDLALLDPEES